MWNHPHRTFSILFHICPTYLENAVRVIENGPSRTYPVRVKMFVMAKVSGEKMLCWDATSRSSGPETDGRFGTTRAMRASSWGKGEGVRSSMLTQWVWASKDERRVIFAHLCSPPWPFALHRGNMPIEERWMRGGGVRARSYFLKHDNNVKPTNVFITIY